MHVLFGNGIVVDPVHVGGIYGGRFGAVPHRGHMHVIERWGNLYCLVFGQFPDFLPWVVGSGINGRGRSAWAIWRETPNADWGTGFLTRSVLHVIVIAGGRGGLLRDGRYGHGWDKHVAGGWGTPAIDVCLDKGHEY